jgi:hypothetical protein
MEATRDVIYDFLPAYFAGEVSADTKALIDEFFATEPEFGQMAERLRLLHQETRHDESVGSEARSERETFDRAKARMQRRQAARCGLRGPSWPSGWPCLPHSRDQADSGIQE